MTPRLLLLCALAFANTALARPYVPASGAQVIERLPRRTDPVQRELAHLRAALTRMPRNLGVAALFARRCIEQARIEGDPRYLGYAEAALAPWWKEKAPPSQVLLLRATLLQSTHRFAAALADLDTVLARDAGNTQAWLTRATVAMVTGDHAAARASCERLRGEAPPLVAQTCLSSLGSVTGAGRRSYTELAAALSAQQADPGVRLWIDTLLAEMAARRGDAAQAQRHFDAALAAGEPDSYLLAAYADFLLDRKRPQEVVRLLKDHTRADNLLLRYAIALKASGAPEAGASIAALRDRFDAAMLRGDTVHQREQARFELVLRSDPQAAVRLAKANWAVQKEPADLRILLEAARAAKDAQALQLAQDWIRRTGIEDVALRPGAAS
jgi:Tfp pilus assembly protein PilF